MEQEKKAESELEPKNECNNNDHKKNRKVVVGAHVEPYIKQYLDNLVRQGIYANRSKAIEAILTEDYNKSKVSTPIFATSHPDGIILIGGKPTKSN